MTVVAEGMTSQLTYDGVDVCASRVAWEVDQHIARLETHGRRVTRFSVVSRRCTSSRRWATRSADVSGTRALTNPVVARFLVGLLEARSPSFFDTHKPGSFSTIATPHLGIPRYSGCDTFPNPDTFLSAVLSWLGGKLLSRSGEQLHIVDTYSETDPRPLLEIMADPSESMTPTHPRTSLSQGTGAVPQPEHLREHCERQHGAVPLCGD